MISFIKTSNEPNNILIHNYSCLLNKQFIKQIINDKIHLTKTNSYIIQVMANRQVNTLLLIQRAQTSLFHNSRGQIARQPIIEGYFPACQRKEHFLKFNLVTESNHWGTDLYANEIVKYQKYIHIIVKYTKKLSKNMQFLFTSTQIYKNIQKKITFGL